MRFLVDAKPDCDVRHIFLGLFRQTENESLLGSNQVLGLHFVVELQAASAEYLFGLLLRDLHALSTVDLRSVQDELTLKVGDLVLPPKDLTVGGHRHALVARLGLDPLDALDRIAVTLLRLA